jgi:hypothetical protein
MSVDPNFDLNVILNMIKTGSFRNVIYVMCWTGWEWRQMRNASSVLHDPYVLNLSNLGRPN